MYSIWIVLTITRLRCCNVLAAWGTTSARKAHLRMTLKDEVRRGVEPRLLVLMVRLLVLLNWITRSLGARLNAASDTSLHCPRRTKVTKSIELGFDAPAQKLCSGPKSTIKDLAESVYWKEGNKKRRRRGRKEEKKEKEVSSKPAAGAARFWVLIL